MPGGRGNFLSGERMHHINIFSYETFIGYQQQYIVVHISTINNQIL